ncbi:MAG: protein phosphatase CheZ [Nitrospirota bacterium]|nr:protein phosphatase CheZ [Nitrospirota bacterium]
MAEHRSTVRGGTTMRQMVGFRLGTEKFAIDIGKIHEIIKPRPVTMLPDIPEGYSGMIQLRDRVVVMADLHLRFGLPPHQGGKDARIIVLERPGQPVGILVDAVSEVVRFSPQMIESPPDFSNGARVACIDGVGKLGGELLTILNLDVLFTQSDIVLADLGRKKAAKAAATPAKADRPDANATAEQPEKHPAETEPAGPESASMTEPETETAAMPESPSSDPDWAPLAATPLPPSAPGEPTDEAITSEPGADIMNDDLYQDLGHLARYINRAHQSFNASLQDDEPIRVKAKDLPTATDILQQVTLDTENATMRIMSGVEEASGSLNKLRGIIDELDAAIPASSEERAKAGDIIERMRDEITGVESLQDQTLITLSFQDLTGQKIKQVMALMMEIEERILGMVVKFGVGRADEAAQEVATQDVAERIDDVRAKPNPGLRQDRVDSLLADFGF